MTLFSRAVCVSLGAFLLLAPPGRPLAQSTYLTPPKVIVDILEAPTLPGLSLSPTRSAIALLERSSMPSIAEVSAPMLRLAGMRISPRTNGLHRPGGIRGLRFKSLPDGDEKPVKLPPGAVVQDGSFSPDGKRYAFTVAQQQGIELWIAEVSSGRAQAVAVGPLNAVAGNPCGWLSDNASLLCRLVPAGRGQPPAPPSVPSGPNVQESQGQAAPVPTFEDLLENEHDEALFEYYYTSQLALVDASSGKGTPIGRPGLFEIADMSPNDEFILTSTLKRPFSRLVGAARFPKNVDILNRRGETVKRLADLPVAESIPINGVAVGPRSFRWNPSEPATLVWVEALDRGDPQVKVPHRDRVLALTAPFSDAPRELAKTQFRFSGLSWTERGVGLLTESDRRTRRTATWILRGTESPGQLWNRSQEDAYTNPGTPLTKSTRGGPVIVQLGDSIFLAGAGASPAGDRPFMDRLNLTTRATERLFQSADKSYETVLGVLGTDGRSILTRHESTTEPPNYFVRELPDGKRRAVTLFKDPAPQLAGVTKELITYTRNDGVKLSATLYLPPGYRSGERLPLLMWAYPREFTDPAAAGQVTGSPNRFTTVGWESLQLLLLTQGYAVLDGPTMPIVGPGDTANDTYVEQLVASAEAALEAVVQRGVADRQRVAIGGHSYGAFMTANLLAHSDLFRAGIARSGAYNRTLTPFGFQNEQRTFWQAPALYGRMSPFFYADKINEPLLLIHGEADNNSGTFPIQSERFYMALKGHGATVRYVTLPAESHGYQARESILHTVAEMLNWADKHVKNASAPSQTR
jgi:dipeptidyl aminopeptidase/acylaminoacyl peptidase